MDVSYFLSGMKAYRRIVGTLAKGYLLGIVVGLVASQWELNGLLLGVLTGHSYLLFSFLHHIVREYPGSALLKFDFLDRNRSFYSLFAVGTLYYLAVWVDKLIFWFVPYTSEAVIGPLRASIIYDLPIFLAYLFILPGMAVFLVTMEADFAEQHERFYRAVREGDTPDAHRAQAQPHGVRGTAGNLRNFQGTGIDGGAVSVIGEEIFCMLSASLRFTSICSTSMLSPSACKCC